MPPCVKKLTEVPGLWSTARSLILGRPLEPRETGDLAYRGTFSLEQLQALNDSRLDQLCALKSVNVWLGPDKHAVFYPLRDGKEFNLVLLRPDDMPHGTTRVDGDLDEMRASFEGWDPMCVFS